MGDWVASFLIAKYSLYDTILSLLIWISDKSMNSQLIEIAKAFRKGSKASAKRSLAIFIKNNPQNAQAWYLASFLVSSPTQQVKCLQRVMSLSPNFFKAKARLEKLISMLEDESKLKPKKKKENGLLKNEKLLMKNTFYLLRNDVTPIKKLNLSRRVYNALFRGGVMTVGDLVSLSTGSLLAFRNIGENSLAEIGSCLSAYLAEASQLVQNDQPELLLDELPIVNQEKSRQIESDLPIEVLGLSVRSCNALRRSGIETIRQLTSLSDTQLMGVKNVGDKSFRKIQSGLEAYLAENPEVIRPQSVQGAHVQSSPDAIAPELLDQLATVPIDEISIERLGLSPIMIKGLNRQGIEMIGQLVQDVDRLAKDSSIGEPLNHYLTWLLAQDEAVWADEIANVGICPLFRLVLAETTVEAMIDEWLGNLTKREREIINGRFSLQGNELTLKEIGGQLGVTRERVRQIQKKALRKLENRYVGKGRELLKPLFAYLRQVFIEHGGLISRSEIIVSFESNETIQLGEIDPVGVMLLLCEIDAQFYYFKKQQVAALSKYSVDTITSVQACFAEILEKEYTPVSGEILLTAFKKTELYAANQDWQTDYPDDFFMACLRVHPKIEQLDSELYILTKWSKKRLGAMILALRKIGEPAHFSVITEKANELLPPDQQLTVRNVHAWLGRYTDIFVWVRLRGTYGLKEWGLELELSYVDACAQIFENAGHPLTLDRVLAQMPQVRQFFDESSVLITLSTHERFYSFSNNRYGLAEWTTTQSEADFADLFGTQLARKQAELDRQNKKTEIDTQQEVDTIRKLGLDFFSD